MDENYGNVAGAGVGYVSYIGAKQVARKITKPYGRFALENLTKWTPKENKILKQATYDAFNISGLKGKHFHLHHVDEGNFEFLSKLLDKKFEIFTEKNKYIKKLKDFSEKIKSKKFNLSEFMQGSISGIDGKTIPNSWKKCDELKAKILKSGDAHKVNTNFEELKGLKVFRLSKFEIFMNRIKRILKGDKKAQSLKEKIKIVSEGKNAFCSSFTRDIMVNTEKFAGASFHEMGHALNASGGKFMKALSIGRHLSLKLGIPIILATALLKSKKKDGEQPKGFIDKVTTFVKNNARTLAFAAWIPTLAEEGIASIRGGQLAKKVLDPSILKKVNKNNFLAWTTYFLAAVTVSGSIALASKIKDKITAKS